MMPHRKFDRDQVRFKKLSERKNKVDIINDHVSPGMKSPLDNNEIVIKAAGKIRRARQRKRSVILAFGAHTIKNGLAPVLIRLMEKGWVTHLATNGAGIIHDWEFAFQGKSSEDVRENIRVGQFGIWEETCFFINLALVSGAYEGLGYGESIGRMIEKEGIDIPETRTLKDISAERFDHEPEKAAAAADFAMAISRFGLKAGFMKIPHLFKSYSVQAAAFRLGIPFTGHPMIGHDIIYTHPMNNGAALGRTAINDFLAFTESVSNISDGVYISLGSAVMSPMIFEKALSMSQNVMLPAGKRIEGHYILVADLAASDWDWKKGEPPSDNPAYYMRYCKTFSRMGGEMDYLTADNRDLLLGILHELER